MMGFIIRILATALGRWVLGGLVTALLAGGAWKWHSFKEDLIHKGQQVCVQEINKETVEQLKLALAAAESARAELTASLIAAAAVNQEAIARRVEAEGNITALQKQMEDQRNEDPEYKEWGDTSLPTGVDDRLRSAQAGDNPSPIRDNQD